MCSNETNYQNANWISIQSGKTQNGTCNANFFGSPSRQCTQSGSYGVWNLNVNNPCTRNNTPPPFIMYFTRSFITSSSYILYYIIIVISNHVFK